MQRSNSAYTSTSARRIYLGFAALGFSMLFSVMGYWLGYGWSLVDAVYMVMITVFSVGYEEVHPIDTPDLKIFTTIVIIAGCTSLLYILGGIVQMATEGHIERALSERRYSREIKEMHDHIIVCGFGRHGQVLARELSKLTRPFVIVDTNEDRLADARAAGYMTYEGNATQEDVLEAAGIARAHTIATVLPDDAANVFITLSARTLNEKIQIIARGELPSTERKLVQAGANHVVLPAAIGAERIAHIISRDDESADSDLAGNLSKVRHDLNALGMGLIDIDVEPNSPHLRKTVHEVNIEHASEFAILGVRRSDGTFFLKPECGFQLEEGDAIVLLTPAKANSEKVAS